MGAPHGDPYSVSPLGCYLHSYHLLLAGYSSFYTRLFYPSNANYEKSKVISEGAKNAKVETTFLPPTICSVGTGTKCTEDDFHSVLHDRNLVSVSWFHDFTWFPFHGSTIFRLGFTVVSCIARGIGDEVLETGTV